MLLARVAGMTFPDAADAIGKESGSSKLSKMRKIMIENGAADVAAIIRRHKKTYEKRIVPRNRIAHARVSGIWMQDEDYVVFMVFERHLEIQLAIEMIPLQEIRRSTAWAKAVTGMALRLVDATS